MRLTANTGRQKIVKNLPSGHLRTTLSGYIFATKTHFDNREKLVKQQCLLHMSPQYGELRPTSAWDQSGSLGHPSKFQRVLHFGSITAVTSRNGSQPNFARCLSVSWAGTLHIYFWGFLPHYGILPGAKFTFHPPSLALSYFLVALLRGTWAVGKLCSVEHRVPPIFGRSTITLGIGPHSSIGYFSRFLKLFFCFLSTRQEIGWEEHLQNDLFCVEWDVEP